MKHAETKIEFFFQKDVVGYFLDGAPTSSGKCAYTPYRGSGHFRLGESLLTNGPQECSYVLDGLERRMVVVNIPVYGILEIALPVRS